jgi:transcriptional regulator with XRE-family HTH domain
MNAVIVKDMNLKSQLRFFLKSKGLNASQLAKMAGVPRQSIGDWLNGTTPRNINHVKNVAKVLGTTMDNLLYDDGQSIEQQKVIELEALLGEGWVSGLFEVKFRRVKKLEKI